MFSFDVSEIGILSTILLAAICLVCTVLVRQIPAIGWKHRVERDLNLLKKLKEEAQTTEEVELVNTYRRRIFRSVEKGLYRPKKVRTKVVLVVQTFLGTVIATVEVLLCWGIPAIFSGDPFLNCYLWIVVIFGIGLDVMNNYLRKKEWKNLNTKQNVKKDSSYEIETTKSK